MSARKALNSVSEFTPLHQLFIQSMDQTPLSSSAYSMNKHDLFLVLDAYMANVDMNNPYSVLKMPYYPLNCLELFLEYFDSQVVFLYTNRPIEKTVTSYVRRGEDRRWFLEQPIEIFRQVKKLDLEGRIKVLTSLSGSDCFRRVVQRCEYLRDQWNEQHAEKAFITIEVEKLAVSKEYLCNVLDKMCLPQNEIEEMFSVIDSERLLNRGRRASSQMKISTAVRSMIPPVMADFLKKFIHRQ